MHLSRLVLWLCSLVLVVGCGGGYSLNPAPVCGDGVSESPEECDGEDLSGATCATLGLEGGTLACGGTCTFDVSGCDIQSDCGNGSAEYPEECDGTDLADTTCVDLGYDSGDLACTGGCTFDESGCTAVTACDGQELEPGEDCDGVHLGGESCESLGLGTGTLACDANCEFDTSGCSQQAVCGNDSVEFPELCDGPDLAGADCTDAGYYTGTLACNATCDGYDASGCSGECGDDVVNGPEVCDGSDLDGQDCVSQGYYPGTLACESGCAAFDFTGCGGSCGDGVLNGPEVCDGGDFGSDSCQVRGFYTGTLVCSGNCATVDQTGCSGFCGDGAINGPEVCDGTDVGTATCPSGTPPICQSDCSSYTCDAVIVTEVSLGAPDWVELMNIGSTTVSLHGWSIEWFGYDNGTPVSGVFTIPVTAPMPIDLAPGDRYVIFDDVNGGGGPPTYGAGTVTFHENIWWGGYPGAVTLFDPSSAPVDFVRWGGPDFTPPAGTAWSDTPAPLMEPSSNVVGLSRQPDTVDTDIAGDWCVAYLTEGTANDTCLTIVQPGTVLITEIDAGGPDRVELYNPTNSPIDLGGWYLQWLWANGGGYEILPTFMLAGGAYVEIRDDCTSNCPTVDVGGVIHVENLPWWNAGGADDTGGLRLLEPQAYFGVDFVRWGGLGYGPAYPDDWNETTPLPAIPVGVSLGRVGATDTNTEADWCLLDVMSFGAVNDNNDPSDPNPCR